MLSAFSPLPTSSPLLLCLEKAAIAPLCFLPQGNLQVSWKTNLSSRLLRKPNLRKYIIYPKWREKGEGPGWVRVFSQQLEGRMIALEGEGGSGWWSQEPQGLEPQPLQHQDTGNTLGGTEPCEASIGPWEPGSTASADSEIQACLCK